MTRVLPAYNERAHKLQQSCFVRAGARCELIALDVLGRAQDSGAAITAAVVTDRLDQLRSHRASCRCGRCAWLRGVSAAAVCRVLTDWQVVDPAEVVVDEGGPVCAWCGGVFATQRVDVARYCSARCRVAAYKSRR